MKTLVRGARKAKAATRRKSRRRARRAVRKPPASFARLWARLGNEVVRVAKRECGLDRRALVAALSRDPGLRRLLIEKIAKVASLIAAHAPPAGRVDARAADPRTVNDPLAPVLGADPEASHDLDEYTIAARWSAARKAEETSAAPEESSDWRLF